MDDANQAAEQAHRDELAAAVKKTPKRITRAPIAKLSRIDAIRKVVSERQAARIEGVLVDLFTASMLVAVHDALSEENRSKLLALPLRRMVDIGWKLYGKCGK